MDIHSRFRLPEQEELYLVIILRMADVIFKRMLQLIMEILVGLSSILRVEKLSALILLDTQKWKQRELVLLCLYSVPVKS